MDLSEHEHLPILKGQRSSQHDSQQAQVDEGPVRISLLLGFLIVLLIEGWMMAKLLLY